MSLNINTKLTNNLNGYLLDGENVKNSIVVYDNTSALSNIPSAVLSTGLIAYIKADESFYKYNGETWAKLKSLSGTEIVSVSTSDDYSTVNGYLSNQKYVYFSYADDITGVQYMLPLIAKILETNTYFIYFSGRIKEKVVIASVNSNDDQWNIIQEDQYVKPKESENISIANNGTISDTTALQKIADKQPVYLNGRIAYYSCEVNSVKQYESIYYDTTNNKTVLVLYKIASNGNTTIISLDSSTYQEKLTTTSVNDGTINKVIGFDTNGDIVKATNIVVDQVYNSSSSNAQSGVAVASAISNALSGVYHFEGTKTVEELNLLTGQTNGAVYNVSNSGVLTSGNISVNAGDNVAWVSSTSTWDKLASDIDLSSYYTKTETNTLLGGKQNTIDSSHKLSADLIQDGTNNKVFSLDEQTKLSGIQTGAQVNVQADWNQTNSSADDYIKNKPTIPTDTNQKIKVGSTTFGDDAVVELVAGTNTTITPDSTNNTITINATSGGSTVEANPVSAPTANLNSVDIDGTIYRVQLFTLSNTNYLAEVVFTFADSSTATYTANYEIVDNDIYLTNLEVA